MRSHPPPRQSLTSSSRSRGSPPRRPHRRRQLRRQLRRSLSSPPTRRPISVSLSSLASLLARSSSWSSSRRVRASWCAGVRSRTGWADCRPDERRGSRSEGRIGVRHTHAPENVSLKLARPSMLLFYMRHLAWPSGWILVGAMCEAHEKDTRAAEARDTAPTEVGHTDSAYTVWPKL